jgi:hypothetical protein
MLRLAVSDANDSLWRQVATRLRGAILETCDQNSSETCDAGVFLRRLEVEGLGKQPFFTCGKPVLLSAEVWWSEEAGRLLPPLQRCTVANLDRYLPSRQLIRQQLDEGKLGEPGLIRVHRWETAVTQVRGPRNLPTTLLCDLDVVLWFFGKLPNQVYAIDSDSVLVHLGFPGGGMALLDNAHALPGDGYRSLSVIGSAGAAYSDDHQNMQLVCRGGVTEALRVEEGVLHFAALVQDFINSLNTGRDLSHYLEACKQVEAVAAAVWKSIRTGRAIVPEGLG